MKETEQEYVTKDLPSEEAARGRRKANKAAKGIGSTTNKGQQESGQKTSGPKVRHFNFQTYKLHALGDYVQTIQQFGTTDSYTSHLVCSHLLNSTLL